MPTRKTYSKFHNSANVPFRVAFVKMIDVVSKQSKYQIFIIDAIQRMTIATHLIIAPVDPQTMNPVHKSPTPIMREMTKTNHILVEQLLIVLSSLGFIINRSCCTQYSQVGKDYSSSKTTNMCHYIHCIVENMNVT